MERQALPDAVPCHNAEGMARPTDPARSNRARAPSQYELALVAIAEGARVRKFHSIGCYGPLWSSMTRKSVTEQARGPTQHERRMTRSVHTGGFAFAKPGADLMANLCTPAPQMITGSRCRRQIGLRHSR